MKYAAFLLAMLVGVAASSQVVTQHNDNSRSGQNVNEAILTPTNVNMSRFGKLFSVGVDGFVVAQPLYLPNITIADRSVHNVVYVATQHDSVFAFDAQSGAVLWSQNLIPSGATTVPNVCLAPGFTEVGIVGTPVIDPTSNTIYVVAKTLESNKSTAFRLHALDVASGAEELGGPVVITASVMNGSNPVTFRPAKQFQRPGLLLSNGTLYLAFGSNGCDTAPGWFMAYDATTLVQLAVRNLDPDQTIGASLWQSGNGPAADSTNNVYFATANGAFNLSVGDCGECVLKLGSLLTLEDYFSPADRDYLDAEDLDLGSGGVLLLPDQPSSPTHLLVAAGKEGTVYLLNRDNLGQFNSSDQVVQELLGGIPQVSGGGTGAAYWNSNLYYATTKGLRMFTLRNGLLSAVSIPPAASTISGKGLPSISANGTSNGILWVLRGPAYSTPQLAAYNANNLVQLYSTAQAANGRDTLSATAHFATPTIANGRVYVGTQTQLVAYGLLPVLNVFAGNKQTGTAGTTLPKLLQVKAKDPYSGIALAGVSVSFSDGGAGGGFGSPISVTNSNGIASTTYTLPPTPGTITISATATGFVSATFIEVAQ